jgi:hypothetical protein
MKYLGDIQGGFREGSGSVLLFMAEDVFPHSKTLNPKPLNPKTINP